MTRPVVPGTVEQEWGVPIPGCILPPEQWVRTAVKRLPPAGPLDVAALFGRSAPLIVDIGCGNGRFTLASALARPECNHLAVDVLPVVIRYATRRANQRGLSNTRWVVIGGRELLRDYLSPGSATEIHCYHPQPYYFRRDRHRRLIAPDFLALVHRTLIPGGQFVVQTDHPAYARYMQHTLPHFFSVREHPDRWPDAPAGRTRREILALRERLPIYRAICLRKDELTDAQRDHLAATLPRPTFNADRRTLHLDQLETAADTPSFRR
jgi:tRNA (guanine-N7-)-methyltransferase